MCGSRPTNELRDIVRAAYLADEATTVHRLAATANLTPAERTTITAQAADLVEKIRAEAKPGIMVRFLGEYGLSTKEGVALMCLAEAMLRVPDTFTIDALIADKITPGDWGRHLGGSSSPLVNASTWALLLTGRVLSADETEGLVHNVRGVVKRLGEPVVRTAVARAMTELGEQFVLGRTIGEAMDRAAAAEASGYTYSYDMLGEAARTELDADRYHAAYEVAIETIATRAADRPPRDNPGISVKLSALHPRYEFAKCKTVVDELAERAGALARHAGDANIGFNIDAEEADRLDLSLDIVAALLADDSLAGWDGLGVVVQAYTQRAAPLIDWLYDTAGRHRRKIMVRLVKGAYWDTEIKRAQVLGLAGFPVFTRKAHTDISYLACARKLLGMQDRIYAQFATHNAHSTAAILQMCPDGTRYEFQRLHGMGDALHDLLISEHGARSRIYAPVGSHQDLLAYLVRRLLENGANSSFVNQIVDKSVPVAEIARDPLTVADGNDGITPNPAIAAPIAIFGAARRNAKGWDLTDPLTVAAIDAERDRFRRTQWRAEPLPTAPTDTQRTWHDRTNPANKNDVVGQVADATAKDVESALAAAINGFPDWSRRPTEERAACLERLADLYEANVGEFIALCCREAGKTLPDSVAEVREAVDFCRYYAAEARRDDSARSGRGVFICISPWNFPLAIFTGQIAAALVAGNAVIAKPAEQTPLIAARAVSLMREAGVPDAIIQLLPGEGPAIGGALVADPRIAGVCFTGSTETAQHINRAMADAVAPDAPLIAETGGLNAMIVDSTALPEQVVRDVVTSAFQSAGQRCSALRMLYVQEEVADRTLAMLDGAIDTLAMGDPWDQSTDIGPVIDREAKASLLAHCLTMDAAGRRLKRLDIPEHFANGHFVPPTVYRVKGIAELEREVFGPILNVATYKAEQLDQIVDDINAAGYGLTFAVHTRVDRRVQRVIDRAQVGNMYVNRNQIGAVVGSQPFGGENLSGTGPKAGGPFYLSRFRQPASQPMPTRNTPARAARINRNDLQAVIDEVDPGGWPMRNDRTAVIAAALPDMADLVKRAEGLTATIDLPGPTGESNRLSVYPRGTILCLGALDHSRSVEFARRQAAMALALGNCVVIVTPGAQGLATELEQAGAPVAYRYGTVIATDLTEVRGIAAVAAVGGAESLSAIRQELAARQGPIVPLVTDPTDPLLFCVERAVCIDTTAAGGNATLLATAGG